MRIRPVEQRKASKPVWHELKEGWSYVTHFVPIRSILLLLALVSLVGMQYTVLMPIFAGQVLHGGPHTLGFLMGASGVGALAGAMFLATRKSVLGLGRIIPSASAGFGVGLIALGLSRYLWLSLTVMSFYSMAFLGMAPFGSLLAGGLAHQIGAPRTVLISGAVCIAGAAWFASQLNTIREHVRPIYRTLGIIPEIASGIQTASVLSTFPEE